MLDLGVTGEILTQTKAQEMVLGDDIDVVSDEMLDIGLEVRVMRASQYEGVDVGGKERIKMFTETCEGSRVVVVFNVRDEVGSGFGDDDGVRLEFVNFSLEGARSDGAGGG